MRMNSMRSIPIDNRSNNTNNLTVIRTNSVPIKINSAVIAIQNTQQQNVAIWSIEDITEKL